MSTRKLTLPVSGFTDGLNTEASVLTIRPSEFMLGTVNVELLQNGSVRRRRGVDFIAANDSGDFLQEVRVSTETDEVRQESPAAVEVELTAPNGNIVRRIIVDINNEFWIYESSQQAMRNFDTPTQVITRAAHSHDLQKNVNMQFAQSGDRVYFAGRNCHPGYLKVHTDNTTLTASYFNVTIRDPDNLTNTLTLHNASIAPTVDDTYPTTVAFFAGRIWLAGDPKLPNRVFFSQVIQTDTELSKFYQESDPNGSDPAIVDSDGGDLTIQGAAFINKMIPVGTSIFACSTTGIWQIYGPDGVFKANNFANSKVLTDGCPGAGSAVATGDDLVIYGNNTIWKGNIERSISVTTSGKANFSPLSDNKVESLYTAIPRANKTAARAIYDPSARKIYYFYNANRNAYTSAYGYIDQPGYVRNALIFDTRFDDSDELRPEDINAQKRNVKESFSFYEWEDTASTSGEPYIASEFIAQDVPSIDEEVTVDGVLVTVGGEAVLTSGESAGKDIPFIIALAKVRNGTQVTIQGAFGKLAGTGIKDWSSDINHDRSFTSKILTGIQTLGDVKAVKSATYIVFVFKKVETGVLVDDIDTNAGGCFLRTAWQFSTSTESSKYGSQYQIYIPDRFLTSNIDSSYDGHDHTWYKYRARGRGNALQIILENDGDKDFHLIGWSQEFYGR